MGARDPPGSRLALAFFGRLPELARDAVKQGEAVPFCSVWANAFVCRLTLKILRLKVRVLVVDDSRFSRGVLRGLFEKVAPGCTVLEAGNAVEALSTVGGESAFDVITIDLHMPGKDGLTLAAELQEKKTAGRMALVSANSQQAIQERAVELGLDFVAKPLSEAKIQNLMSVQGR